MKKISNIYLFFSLIIAPFFIAGCSSDGVDWVNPSEMYNKHGMVILHNSSEAYCQDNVVLSGVSANQDYEFIVIAMEKNDVACVDYGKDLDYCESFIAKDEPDAFACLIGYDFVPEEDGRIHS